MKKALPANGKIAKNAKETVQECMSEFICFITSEVSDKCQREKRKTINGDDLLWSMSSLGFEDYIEDFYCADACCWESASMLMTFANPNDPSFIFEPYSHWNR